MAKNTEEWTSRRVHLAPLMEEAITTLDPLNGLTPNEIVRYVSHRLEKDPDAVRMKVKELLKYGAQKGTYSKTHDNRYVVQDVETISICGTCGGKIRKKKGFELGTESRRRSCVKRKKKRRSSCRKKRKRRKSSCKRRKRRRSSKCRKRKSRRKRRSCKKKRRRRRSRCKRKRRSRRRCRGSRSRRSRRRRSCRKARRKRSCTRKCSSIIEAQRSAPEQQQDPKTAQQQ